MEKLNDIAPIFGFILSLILLGYGLKKIFLKIENNQKET